MWAGGGEFCLLWVPEGQFLSLGTSDILVWIILGCEGLSCALWDIEQHARPLPTKRW